MKGMKGRFLKKLKFIPTNITTLKQGLILQLNPQRTFSDQNCHINQSLYKHQDCKTNNNNINFPETETETESESESESESEYFNVGDQVSNIAPCIEANSQLPILKTEEIYPCLTDFEEKCPPGGENSVIFYTTSLRGIRKTYEDCSSVRFLLNSFKILVHERDVSMDKEYREELWNILGSGERVIPPKLFIKGRYIGGADEVVGLHEQGKLKKLLEEVPTVPAASDGSLCTGCAGFRFLVCSNCNGSRKVKEGDDDDHHHHELCIKKCPVCNENGLVRCPVCC